MAAAGRIGRELGAGGHGELVAFRTFIGLNDDLAALSGTVLADSCADAPALCGDPRYDALVAAIIEHYLEAAGLPAPDWVHESERTLNEPWVVSPYTDPADEVPAFRRHGVHLAASELARA